MQLPTLTLAVPPSQAATRLPEIGDSRRKVPAVVVGGMFVPRTNMARICKNKVRLFMIMYVFYVVPSQKFNDLVDLY